MFGTVNETPYDLQFQLGGIPVRISVWFWVMGSILGYSALRAGVPYLLAWLLVLLVSILVHEMGHALTARWFGHQPSILLYQFGGLAFYHPFRNHTRGKSILISLAGPGAGFVLWGLVLLFVRFVLPHIYHHIPENFQSLLGFVLMQLLYINLYWGLVNLLPVLPLDGGRVCQEICTAISPFKGYLYAAWVGLIVGGLAALWFFSRDETYPGFLFAMLAASNYSMIQQLNSQYRG
ncbi:site-2 protease family protein [Planctomicrobium sp. SH661]|uniref:site-2 protease family protein n=1 Tax=Planctomicrobium sp. SH661 TaxID=3448124 RepID=UPI003F5C7181